MRSKAVEDLLRAVEDACRDNGVGAGLNGTTLLLGKIRDNDPLIRLYQAYLNVLQEVPDAPSSPTTRPVMLSKPITGDGESNFCASMTGSHKFVPLGESYFKPGDAEVYATLFCQRCGMAIEIMKATSVDDLNQNMRKQNV